MPSGTFYPSASGDDGFINLSSFLLDNNEDILRIGADSSGNGYDSFIRFNNVTIPKYSIIQYAYISLMAYSDKSGVTCSTKIYLVDADNPAAPATYAEYVALGLTDYVAWASISGWTMANRYSTAYFQGLLQSVIDRAGWESGNSVIALIKNNGSSTSADRWPCAYDFLSGSVAAYLYVEWVETAKFIASATLDAESMLFADGALFSSIDTLASFPTTLLTSTSQMTVSGVALLEIKHPVQLFYLVLTGTPDGEEDYTLPMSSFTCRYRSGDPSYLQCIIPYTQAFANAISARPNGQLVIRLAMVVSGVEMAREEIIRVDLENIRTDEGGRSKSITLVGRRTISFGTPKNVELERVSYRSNDDGTYTLRSPIIDPYLRPGDTVTYDGLSITSDLITYYVGVSDGGAVMQSMEIRLS